MGIRSYSFNKLAEGGIEEKPNIKKIIGMEVIIVKLTEGEDKETTIHAHTMPESA